jgi:hypothetical protein
VEGVVLLLMLLVAVPGPTPFPSSSLFTLSAVTVVTDDEM